MIARYPAWLGDALFPAGSPLAAASHDIGKVSPTFYNKLMKACQRELIPGFPPDLENNGADMPVSARRRWRPWMFHAGCRR